MTMTKLLQGAALDRHASVLIAGDGSCFRGPMGPGKTTTLRPTFAPALPRGAQVFRTPPGSTGGPLPLASSDAVCLIGLAP